MTDATKFVNKLKGKNVLIVGGTSGIGFGVAEGVIEYDGSVVLSSSKQQRVEEAISKLETSYPSAKGRISGYAYDMGTGSTLEDNVVSLLKDATKSAKLDHVVWTAGDALAVAPLSKTTVESLTQAGMVRYFGPIMIGKHAPAYMNKGPASSIVLTTGAVSQKPIPDWAGVGSFATALHGLVRGLALDLAPLRVNLICPGAVETELWNFLPEEARKATFKNSVEKGVTGTIGQVEDVAEAYLYAMRDANTTGEIFNSNSGALLK